MGTCHAVGWSGAMVVQQESRDLQRRLLESYGISDVNLKQ